MFGLTSLLEILIFEGMFEVLFFVFRKDETDLRLNIINCMNDYDIWNFDEKWRRLIKSMCYIVCLFLWNDSMPHDWS